MSGGTDRWAGRAVWAGRQLVGALIDLVLPAECAGCGAPGTPSLCRACAAALAQARPARARPDPAPAGLPATYALAAYAGSLRGALLAYKERGRHRLAGPLGDLLADVVLAGGQSVGPLVLVPVPATAAASRRRHGDHVGRLVRRAVRRLRRRGLAVAAAYPLRALPRADSAELSAAARAHAARSAFATRPRRLAPLRAAIAAGATVVIVDDILTTGVTLAAAAARLRAAGVAVDRAAVLAATQRRRHRRDPAPASPPRPSAGVTAATQRRRHRLGEGRAATVGTERDGRRPVG